VLYEAGKEAGSVTCGDFNEPFLHGIMTGIMSIINNTEHLLLRLRKNL